MKYPNSVKVNLSLYLAAVALLLLCAFVYRSGTVDIHLHDTYFVIARIHLFVGLALVSSVFALLYYLTRRFTRSAILMLLHTLGTVALTAWLFRDIFATYSAPAPGTYNRFRYLDLSDSANLTRTIIRILFWWQLLLPLNWIVSLRTDRRQ